MEVKDCLQILQEVGAAKLANASAVFVKDIRRVLRSIDVAKIDEHMSDPNSQEVDIDAALCGLEELTRRFKTRMYWECNPQSLSDGLLHIAERKLPEQHANDLSSASFHKKINVAAKPIASGAPKRSRTWVNPFARLGDSSPADYSSDHSDRWYSPRHQRATRNDRVYQAPSISGLRYQVLGTQRLRMRRN